MAESQTVEYKETWRDEYLKWICGFANAQGGKMYIGINDKGEPVGVENIKKLLEDIPNKVRDKLGIIVDVDRHTKNKVAYLEITVSPSSFPINYNGEYHYRTGSTKQLLTGAALSEFIMRKTGVRWEDVTVDDISVDDLDDESFKIFRREALKSMRMTREELNVSNAELLDKLHLTVNGKLKRSAVLLFHNDPEFIQTGSFVMIGKFGDDTGIQYQDTIKGSLINAADKVIDLIYLKYLKAKITYEHDVRIETYPFSREAVREAVYNAIAHNCYMFGTPIQIRIEEKAMIISNCCILPDGWTVNTLMEPHNSRPYNPDIANVFYHAGYIEHWGQGIEKICRCCKQIGADIPTYELIGSSIRVRFEALKSALLNEPKTPNRQSGGLNGGLDGSLAERILSVLSENNSITINQISEQLGVSKRTIEREIRSLRDSGKIIRAGGKRFGHWEIRN